jgi:hypothetical protein
LVTKPTQLSDHFSSTLLLRSFADLWASFFVADSSVQDPRPSGKVCGQLFQWFDCVPDAAHSGHRESGRCFLVFGRRIGSLIQNPPHMTVALRRPAAVVHFRALFVPGACAYPRGEMLLGRKRRCGGTHFGKYGGSMGIATTCHGHVSPSLI